MGSSRPSDSWQGLCSHVIHVRSDVVSSLGCVVLVDDYEKQRQKAYLKVGLVSVVPLPTPFYYI
jgi:hypothetical protein